MTDDYDVIVIGGGIAGIVTALELAEKNRKVLILDRDEPDKFGGLAKESFGGMFFVDSPQQRKAGIKDDADLAWRDWQQFAEFKEDDHWPRVFAKTYIERSIPDLYEAVTARGVTYFPVVNWVERGMYIPGNSVPRFHLVWGTGQELANVYINHLSEQIKNKQVEVRFSHKVSELEYQAGRVSGVRGANETNNTPFYFEAQVVVVAAGGINGSDVKIRQHWQEEWGASAPETILNGSHQYADGMMHDEVSRIGGNVTNLDRMWNYAAGVHHPRPRKPRHGLSLVPSKSALWMDAKGRRIGPEPLVSGYDTWELVKRVCEQPEHKYSWAVMNRKIALKELAISGAESNPAVRDKKKISFIKTVLFGNKPLLQDMLDNCVDFVTARSVEELAEKMNALGTGADIDVAGMKADIEAYDAQLDRPLKYRNDDQLRRISHLRQYRGDRVRTLKEQKILDDDALPLIAIRQFVISRKSLGGIQTNLEGQVMDTEGYPIEGLYAVGEAAGFGGGGMHGLRALEGTFLGGCVLTARYAAEAINGDLA
ncbi:FAD-binding dehydrogenase [Sneathiella sp. P13V-1]|uniref:FAD-binding dehydrogenase n=1 Tax=Sneathiella sp. P13V-1 TaxID=2697366 RepID=UPI00187B6F8C|nr:FAD-binding dehydrogenase [Sneathiella sp. P13V-1]MBE7635221.1 FAD-binding dehydrogenase [Sneathiella sp. P13V-1]